MGENAIEPTAKQKQIRRILNYLETHDSISAYEAMTRLSIGSPRKRFSDIRRLGYNLKDKWVEGVNKYGEPWRAKKYWIEKPEV